MDQNLDVAPKVNPLQGLSGDRMKEETMRLVRRVAEFMMSEQGLQAKLKEEHPFGWRLSVDPAVVTARTGADFPVTEIWVRHGNGELLPYYGWGHPDGYSPVIVRFIGCALFDENSLFFEHLSSVFGSDGVVFGLDDGF